MTTRGNSLSTIYGFFDAQLADDFAWISADVALTDSDVFVPATVPAAVTGLSPIADFTPIRKITSATFSGRAEGSKARFSLYGLIWVLDDDAALGKDFIVTGAEYSAVADAVAEASGQFFAGSGQAASFYNQTTLKVNDFLLRKVRKGLIS
jgi:hypothetical protein